MEISKEECKKKYGFYREQLLGAFLPYYMERAIDWKHGGFYSCFSNDGETLVSTNKYMWSQGRFIWIFSRLSRMEDVFSQEERKHFLLLAQSGVDFVLEHGFLEDGRCAFLLDESGQKLPEQQGGGYAGSTFADCYVASGLAMYAAASGHRQVLKKAMEMYGGIMSMYQDKTFQTAPFYVPEGMKCHLVPMILCGMHWDFLGALTEWKDGRTGQVKSSYGMLCQEILDHFCQSCGLVLEMTGEDNKPQERFLGQYVNVGHAMEGMWFILHYAMETGDRHMASKAGQVLGATFDKGWDQVYGGLRYYVGMGQGGLEGRVWDEKEKTVAAQMKRDWNNKIWWVHTESLYALLLHALQYGKQESWDRFLMLEEYVFRTFPNPDARVGEWIYLRRRDGAPATGQVGGRLPVKDPFHPIRNMVLIMDVLKQHF